MNDELKFLDALPRVQARAEFEASLLSDAHSASPHSAPKPHAANSPSRPWIAAVAMAASLALGVWIGLSGALSSDILPRAGEASESLAEAQSAEINLYTDLLAELSS